jgi:hypothetical protein
MTSYVLVEYISSSSIGSFANTIYLGVLVGFENAFWSELIHDSVLLRPMPMVSWILGALGSGASSGEVRFLSFPLIDGSECVKVFYDGVIHLRHYFIRPIASR